MDCAKPKKMLLTKFMLIVVIDRHVRTRWLIRRGSKILRREKKKKSSSRVSSKKKKKIKKKKDKETKKEKENTKDQIKNAGEIRNISSLAHDNRRSIPRSSGKLRKCIFKDTYDRKLMLGLYLYLYRTDDAAKNSSQLFINKMRVSRTQIIISIKISLFLISGNSTPKVRLLKLRLRYLDGTPLAGLTSPVGVRGRELDPFTGVPSRFPETLLCLLDVGVFPVVLTAVLRGIRLTFVDSSLKKKEKTI